MRLKPGEVNYPSVWEARDILRAAIRLYVQHTLLASITDAQVDAVIERIASTKPRTIGAYTLEHEQAVVNMCDFMVKCAESIKRKRVSKLSNVA